MSVVSKKLSHKQLNEDSSASRVFSINDGRPISPQTPNEFSATMKNVFVPGGIGKTSADIQVSVGHSALSKKSVSKVSRKSQLKVSKQDSLSTGQSPFRMQKHKTVMDKKNSELLQNEPIETDFDMSKRGTVIVEKGHNILEQQRMDSIMEQSHAINDESQQVDLERTVTPSGRSRRSKKGSPFRSSKQSAIRNASGSKDSKAKELYGPKSVKLTPALQDSKRETPVIDTATPTAIIDITNNDYPKPPQTSKASKTVNIFKPSNQPQTADQKVRENTPNSTAGRSAQTAMNSSGTKSVQRQRPPTHPASDNYVTVEMSGRAQSQPRGAGGYFYGGNPRACLKNKRVSDVLGKYADRTQLPNAPVSLKATDYWRIYKNPVGSAHQPFLSFSRPDLIGQAPIRRVRRMQSRQVRLGGGTVTDNIQVEYAHDQNQLQPTDPQLANPHYHEMDSLDEQVRSPKVPMLQTSIMSDGIFSHNFTGQSQENPTGMLSKKQVRQNRIRIENDVQKLHNRIQMLQTEEERALKHIEDTRGRVKDMLAAKEAAMIEEKQKLKINKANRKAHNRIARNDIYHPGFSIKDNLTRRSISRERAERVDKQLLSTSKADDSILNEFGVPKATTVSVQKAEEVLAFKHLRNKMLKKRAKEAKLEMEQKRNNKQTIKTMCDQRPKEQKDLVEMKRWETVRKNKEKELLLEIKQMNKKEKDAKKLENLEVKILKRLRETHQKQQQAIEEIQTIFSLNNGPEEHWEQSEILMQSPRTESNHQIQSINIENTGRNNEDQDQDNSEPAGAETLTVSREIEVTKVEEVV